MQAQPSPAAPPSAAGLALSPMPTQRALAGKRMRPPAEPDSELLELGRRWQASRARQQAINAAIDASKDTKAAAFEALLDDMEKEAEVNAQIRRRMVRLRATTGAGLALKTDLATLAYDDDTFADALREDPNVLGSALTMSLLRDLTARFGQPAADAELLALGREWRASVARMRTILDKVDLLPVAEISTPEMEALDRAALKESANATALRRAIVRLPARTQAGIQLKIELALWCNDSKSTDEEFAEALEEDEHATCDSVTLSLLRDLAAWQQPAVDGRPLPVAEPAPAETKAA